MSDRGNGSAASGLSIEISSVLAAGGDEVEVEVDGEEGDGGDEDAGSIAVGDVMSIDISGFSGGSC